MLSMLKSNNFADEVLAKFDNITAYNCCNVIAIVLYLTMHGQSYNKYLRSIEQTVKNVKDNLPDFIVRLYLDTTVYNSNVNPFQILLKQIINYDNVEIYTYNCKSYKSPSNLALTRMLRFLPLCDTDVNVCIIREADGVVSNLDCHNIKIFAKSDRPFYIPDIGVIYNNIDSETSKQYFFRSYSKWLRTFKLTLRQQFFANNQNMYDLLAGNFGTRLKLKKSYFYEKTEELLHEIREWNDTKNDKFAELIKYNAFNPMHNGQQIVIRSISIYESQILSYDTFDEMLLLDIYKEIISIKVPNADISDTLRPYTNDIDTIDRTFVLTDAVKAKFSKIRDALFYADRIKTYNVVVKSGDGVKYDIANALNVALRDVLIQPVPQSANNMFNAAMQFMYDWGYSPYEITAFVTHYIDSLLHRNIKETEEIFNVSFDMEDDDLITGLVMYSINIPYDHDLFVKFDDKSRTIGGSNSNYIAKYMRYA